jgi:hypothetical protein
VPISPRKPPFLAGMWLRERGGTQSQWGYVNQGRYSPQCAWAPSTSIATSTSVTIMNASGSHRRVTGSDSPRAPFEFTLNPGHMQLTCTGPSDTTVSSVYTHKNGKQDMQSCILLQVEGSAAWFVVKLGRPSWLCYWTGWAYFALLTFRCLSRRIPERFERF